jgi:glycosyltransferase involved in cell wall biosynthesis
MTKDHDISFYCGHYKNAESYTMDGMQFNFLGFGSNYLISRITYAISATIHSLFNIADIYVITYSIYSPVLTFLLKPKKTVIQFYHFTGSNVFKKYGPFGIFPWLSEHIVMKFGYHFVTLAHSVAETIKARSGRDALPTYIGIEETLRKVNACHDNYILSFGRIDVRMKGLDTLFDIFEKVASANNIIKLIVAGRGVSKDIQYVKSRIAQSSYSNRITFIENPPDDQKALLLQNSTLVLIPSRFEGWNIVAVEAAANGKPVVASRIPGLSEALYENKTGLLCKTEDVSEFAEKVITLLSNIELYSRLSDEAYKWSFQFDWKVISSKINVLYDSINNLKGKK